MNEQEFNRLWGMRCYLIGAMDRVADNGIGWRRRIIPFLNSLGVVTLDPTNKPISIGLENAENRDYRAQLKGMGDWSELAKEIKLLRAVDLRMVDMSDFLIINIDTTTHACGTYEELTWGNRLKNPCLIHCEQGKGGCPDWLFGVLPHAHIFSEWTHICKYLWQVHTAPEVNSFRRWMFFDYDKMVPMVTPQESRSQVINWDQLNKELDR